MRALRRTVTGGALGVMLGALPGAGAGAQVPVPDIREHLAPAVSTPIPRPTALESHFTRMRVAGTSGRRTADGLGLRLVFGHRALADDEGPPTLARRTELALFGAWTRESGDAHDTGLATTTAGVAADVRPLARPIAGRLEPVLSLGAGMMRTSDRELAPPLTLRWSPMSVERTRTSPALLPGVAARLSLTPRLALQAEARDVYASGSHGRHDAMMSAGLRLSL